MEVARLVKLIKLPDDKCNAATELMKASHHNIVGKGKENGSVLPYPWIEQVPSTYLASIRPFNNPQEIARFVGWSKIPEVDTFREAAKCGSYQMWGVEILPRIERSWFTMPMAYYLDFLRLSWLGVARAMELEKQGKNEEAVAWFHDLMRIGNHLEDDPNAIGYIIGQIIKLRVSKELYLFYLRQGNQQMAEQWKEYLHVMTKRRAGLIDILSHLTWYSEEELKQIVENRDLAKGIRLESYWLLVLRMRVSNPRRFFLGPNDAEKQFLLGTRFEEPEMKLSQLTAADQVNSGLIRMMAHGIQQTFQYYFANDQWKQYIYAVFK